MKKKVLLITLGIAFLLSIIGCGKTQKENEYSSANVKKNEEVSVISDVEAEERAVSENVVSKNGTDETVNVTETELKNEAERVVINLNEHVNNNLESYKKAIFWITNPNAGKVYWGNTKQQYKDYVTDVCIEKEIKKRDNIDLLAYGVEDEIEYAMKYTYNYPELKGVDYDREYDGYSKITEVANLESISYEEMIKNVESLADYGFTEYYTTYKYVNGEQDFTQIDLLSAPHVWGETYITREEMLDSIRTALENPSRTFMDNSEIDVVSNKIILTLGSTIKYVCSTNEQGQITNIEVYNASIDNTSTNETEKNINDEVETESISNKNIDEADTDEYRCKFEIEDELYSKFDLKNRAVYLIEETSDTTIFSCIGYKEDGLLFSAYDYVGDFYFDMLISFTTDNKIEYCALNDEIYNQYEVY